MKCEDEALFLMLRIMNFSFFVPLLKNWLVKVLRENFAVQIRPRKKIDTLELCLLKRDLLFLWIFSISLFRLPLNPRSGHLVCQASLASLACQAYLISLACLANIACHACLVSSLPGLSG